MKITFLGTGTSQGVPVIACQCHTCNSPDARDKRLRSSIMIETHGKTLVIDSGPDFRQQMLREKVKQLNAILFTHEHKDHVGGLDDVRAFNYIQQSAMHVYATARVRAALESDYHYAFAEHKYPGVPDIEIHTIENKAFEVEHIPIIPIEGLHHKLPVMGFRIGGLSYLTDVNYISPEEMKKVEGSELIIITALRHKKHLSHFSLSESLELIAHWAPRQAYLTHISHQLGRYAEQQALLPQNVSLSYDGLSFELPEP